MRKIFCTVAAAAFGSFITASSAFASYREIRFDWYSANLADCQSDATTVGHDLMSRSGVAIVRAYCLPTENGSSDQSIILGYNSDTELKVTAATEDLFDGAYDDDQGCRDDMARQVGLFRQATGISPFLSYCTSAHALRMYGLGISTNRYYGFSMSLGSILAWPDHDPDITDPDALAAQIAAALAAKGMFLARVVVKAGYMRKAGIYVFYYAQQPDQRFGIATLLTLPTMINCQRELAPVEGILRQTGVEPLVQFCAKERNSSYDLATLFTFALRAPPDVSGPFGDFPVDVPMKKVMSHQYESLSDCLVDQSDVEQEEQSMGSQHVVGSVCSLPMEDRSVMAGEPWFYRIIVFYSSN